MNRSVSYWIFFCVIFLGALIASPIVYIAIRLLVDLVKWIWMLS